MSAEVLSSSVLNYLIWRYLQEAGFGNAAIQLSKAWNRNPESLPFAARVERRQLINIVQDGLDFDTIQARVRKGEKRYVFSSNHGPRHSVQSGDPVPELLPYGTALLPQAAASAQTPRAIESEASGPSETTMSRKGQSRKRKGTVSKEQHPQVDHMDLDINGAGQGLQVATSDEAVVSDAPSPAMETQNLPTPPAPLELDYKPSLTEAPLIRTPEATVVSISRHHPNYPVDVVDVAFSPSEQQALLLIGNNLAQVWIVPYTVPTATPFDPLRLDLPDRTDSFRVMAFTWVAPSQSMILGVAESFHNDKGEQLTLNRIVKLTQTTNGFNTQTLSRRAHEIVEFSWNPSTQSLLCLAHCDRGGIIRVFKNDHEIVSPGFMVEYNHAVKWISDDKFILCGRGTICVYELVYDVVSGYTISLLAQHETPHADWHKMVYDPIENLLCLASIDSPALAVLSLAAVARDEDGQTNDMQTSGLSDTPLDIAFQPIFNPSSLKADAPRLLACATESGNVEIFDVRKPFERVARLALGMDLSAQVCAWSSDGFLLAAAGNGRVVVWKAEDILAVGDDRDYVQPTAVWMAENSQKWASVPTQDLQNSRDSRQTHGRALSNGYSKDSPLDGDQPETNGTYYGSAMDIDSDEERSKQIMKQITSGNPRRKQKLLWDHAGKKLIYAVGDQVAFIILSAT